MRGQRRNDEAARAAADAEIGIAWWNGMTERKRLAALLTVEPNGNASPAEAFDHWRFGFKYEETAHGYLRRGAVLVVLLWGGDKRTQDADVKRAITIAKDWKG